MMERDVNKVTYLNSHVLRVFQKISRIILLNEWMDGYT